MTELEEQARILLNAYCKATSYKPGEPPPRLDQTAEGREILQADARTQIDVLLITLASLEKFSHGESLNSVLISLCERHLPYTLKDVQQILQSLRDIEYFYVGPGWFVLHHLFSRFADPQTLLACRPYLERLEHKVREWHRSAYQFQVLRELERILRGQPQPETFFQGSGALYTPASLAPRLLEDYCVLTSLSYEYRRLPLAETASGREILQADVQTRIAIVLTVLSSLEEPLHDCILYKVLLPLCEQHLPYTIEDVRLILQSLLNSENSAYSGPVWFLLHQLAPRFADTQTLLACHPDLELLERKASTWEDTGYRLYVLRELESILQNQPQTEHARRLLDDYYALTSLPDELYMGNYIQLADTTAYQNITQADARTRIAMLHAVLSSPTPPQYRAASDVVAWLCHKPLPYTLEDIQLLLRDLGAEQRSDLPKLFLLRHLARCFTDPQMLLACRPALETLGQQIRGWADSATSRELLRQLDWILWGLPDQTLVPPLDTWGSLIWASFREMQPERRLPWMALLHHCAKAGGSAPSKKWQERMRHLMEELGWKDFWRLFAIWLRAYPNIGHLYAEDKSTIALLKGLIWCCTQQVNDIAVASLLADTAIWGYHVRTAWIANACLYILKSMPGLHGAAQLERVRLKVKQHGYRKLVENALAEAARQTGLSSIDLEEMTVPTFDLQRGRLLVTIGPASAELQVVGSRVRLQWYDAVGKPRKSEPAVVKREHKAELKEVKSLADNLAHMLTAQSDRIERLFLAQRTWSLPTWKERYLEHPLVGTIAQRLIWRFQIAERNISACWLDGRMVDANDQPVELPEEAEEAVVSLWHPVLCSVPEVLAWRNWLERHQVTQPFKQGHREIYVLTEAERITATYSNRFANHILRQHQFHALALGRGWQDEIELMLGYGHTPTTLALPRWDLQADFRVAGLAHPNEAAGAVGYRYVTTHQVRFFELNTATRADAPMPLEQIPPLVFSEVMRDVDLFVGVASMGNDPTWHDPDAQPGNYWHDYSFGNLSATAQTRKELLQRLLPQLTIADRCHIDGHFLVVRGDLRTYKIHLGSSNILMEPHNQYLCIVLGNMRSEVSSEHISLPFEGDIMFSTILSKALLLAEDRTITDPTITRQIGGEYAT